MIESVHRADEVRVAEGKEGALGKESDADQSVLLEERKCARDDKGLSILDVCLPSSFKSRDILQVPPGKKYRSSFAPRVSYVQP